MERFLIGADEKHPVENKAKGKKNKGRQYDDTYLEYGFTQINDRGGFPTTVCDLRRGVSEGVS